jgi:3-dehydroquinate dehydratase/shikimate dehydrogenase
MAPHLFNSCWTYGGPLSALGQIPVGELRDVYRVGRVGADAALFGVAGRPVMHSRSPALHNAAFTHEEIDAVYVPLEAHDFEDFNSFARMFGVRGASITAPLKGDAFAAAVSADPAAEGTRAANTLKRTSKGWIAANTDAQGFLAPLGDMQLQGIDAAVIGVGGAARSVRHALEMAGAKVVLLGRDELERASEPWDLLVHATPVGTAPDVSASVLGLRPIRARVVYDLVYNPVNTQLLQDARAAGARTIGGMPMLVAQACRQFEFWFGRPAPVDVYERAAKALATYETDDIRRVR